MDESTVLCACETGNIALFLKCCDKLFIHELTYNGHEYIDTAFKYNKPNILQIIKTKVPDVFSDFSLVYKLIKNYSSAYSNCNDSIKWIISKNFSMENLELIFRQLCLSDNLELMKYMYVNFPNICFKQNKLFMRLLSHCSDETLNWYSDTFNCDNELLNMTDEFRMELYSKNPNTPYSWIISKESLIFIEKICKYEFTNYKLVFLLTKYCINLNIGVFENISFLLLETCCKYDQHEFLQNEFDRFIRTIITCYNHLIKVSIGNSSVNCLRILLRAQTNKKGFKNKLFSFFLNIDFENIGLWIAKNIHCVKYDSIVPIISVNSTILDSVQFKYKDQLNLLTFSELDPKMFMYLVEKRGTVLDICSDHIDIWINNWKSLGFYELLSFLLKYIPNYEFNSSSTVLLQNIWISNKLPKQTRKLVINLLCSKISKRMWNVEYMTLTTTVLLKSPASVLLSVLPKIGSAVITKIMEQIFKINITVERKSLVILLNSFYSTFGMERTSQFVTMDLFTAACKYEIYSLIRYICFLLPDNFSFVIEKGIIKPCYLKVQ